VDQRRRLQQVASRPFSLKLPVRELAKLWVQDFHGAVNGGALPRAHLAQQHCNLCWISLHHSRQKTDCINFTRKFWFTVVN
jgi:hypothetical protein